MEAALERVMAAQGMGAMKGSAEHFPSLSRQSTDSRLRAHVNPFGSLFG
jgi:hypothetical protein